jgi:TfoX/Sxy family transcriptional regulator of competence genes
VTRAPEEIFEELVERQLNRPGIRVGKMFGSPVLKVAGKVFAMLVQGRLVVKLPESIQDSLLSSRSLHAEAERTL